MVATRPRTLWQACYDLYAVFVTFVSQCAFTINALGIIYESCRRYLHTQTVEKQQNSLDLSVLVGFRSVPATSRWVRHDLLIRLVRKQQNHLPRNIPEPLATVSMLKHKYKYIAFSVEKLSGTKTILRFFCEFQAA